jgi:hypothetical protein
MEKEVQKLNGEPSALEATPKPDSAGKAVPGAAFPAFQGNRWTRSRSTALFLAAVVVSEVVVRGGDKKPAATPQKPVLGNVSVRAFAQAVDVRRLVPQKR